MMGRLDWGRTCFAMRGKTYAPSQTDEIMSKYRPIAPKPALHITSNNLCKSNSVLDFSSRVKGNSNAKSGNGGHNRSGHRRRASDCSNSPSPRALKRSKGPNESSTHNTVGASVPADRPGIVYNFQKSFSAEKPISEKPELEVMERAAAGRSVVDKKHAGFEGLDVKTVMNSIGTPSTKMADTQCGCGSANYFVFPIVNDIQQEEEKNLVTLPLLPETPESVLGSTASGSTSTDHRPDICKCDKEEIPLRLFGRDFTHKEVGACQIRSNESPKPGNVVPIVGLSFL